MRKKREDRKGVGEGAVACASSSTLSAPKSLTHTPGQHLYMGLERWREDQLPKYFNYLLQLTNHPKT